MRGLGNPRRSGEMAGSAGSGAPAGTRILGDGRRPAKFIRQPRRDHQNLEHVTNHLVPP